MKKTLIRIVCFMSILIGTLYCFNKVLKVKYGDGIYSVTKFYELEDGTVDVLFLGSSHAFEDFNTGTLWDEYGMSSYVLGGSGQPVWNSYFYLKEALKTQTPELIILEGYRVAYGSEYSGDNGIIKNNFGLKWSLNKVNSIKISAPKERWNEFLLEYAQYHSRYSELDAGDFKKNQGNKLYDDWKGFGCNMRTASFEIADVSDVVEKVSLHEKTEEYYRKVIELAQENNIPIVIVISPYAGVNEYEQQKFNSASDIAEEYNVPFINCNCLIDEIGIDYLTDASDADHLNYRGNQKFSKYMGAYLKEHFEISDRRGNVKYESWQRNADFIRQMIEDQLLVETYDIYDLWEKMQNPNYWILISADGNCNTSDEHLSSLFEQMGIYEKGINGVWLRRRNEIEGCFGDEESEQFIRTSAHDFGLKHFLDEDGKYTNAIIYDNEQYQKVENGINVFVYDTKTEKMADMFGIDMDDGYKVVREN